MSEALAALSPMAESSHLSADLCRRFLDGRVSVPEKRAFVRHLLSRCEVCLGLFARITAEGGYWSDNGATAARGDRDYSAAFEAAFTFATAYERQIAVERLRGWAHWSALDPLPSEERLSVIVEHKDWHHWGLFRALLDASRWYRARDPLEASDIATLALQTANLLDPQAAGGEAAARDMWARGYAVLADCRRIAHDLEGARKAIAEAWELNEDGAGDPLDKAHLYRVDASYAAAVGEFETAEAILEQALSLYLMANEPHLQGRTLIAMGEMVGYLNPDRGIAHIQRGLELLNAAREPRMELRAEHHLADFLCMAGRPQEALAILDRTRPLYRQFEEETVELRLHWLEGRIAQGLGEVREAIEILRLAREEYRARDLRREFVLLTIDLVEAHLRQGERATALRLLEETIPTLASWNLHQNGLAAWLQFQKTLEEGRSLGAEALAPLFESLRLYYRRFWLVPGATFVVW